MPAFGHLRVCSLVRLLPAGLAETGSGERVILGKGEGGPLNKDHLWTFWTKARDAAGIVADAHVANVVQRKLIGVCEL